MMMLGHSGQAKPSVTAYSSHPPDEVVRRAAASAQYRIGGGSLSSEKILSRPEQLHIRAAFVLP
jgi:hypothetical protein